jgi:hypothetical protein
MGFSKTPVLEVIEDPIFMGGGGSFTYRIG